MATVLSVMVLLMIALVLGAVWLWRRNGMSRQVGLMLLLAAIVAANIAIWTVPVNDGGSLLDSEPMTDPAG